MVDSDEDTSDKSADEDHQHALEELTNLQFKFEVKEVCCWLLSSVGPREGEALHA